MCVLAASNGVYTRTLYIIIHVYVQCVYIYVQCV